MDFHNVLQNIKMAMVPPDYILQWRLWEITSARAKKVDVYYYFSFVNVSNFFLIDFSDGDGKEENYHINIQLPNARACVNLLKIQYLI